MNEENLGGRIDIKYVTKTYCDNHNSEVNALDNISATIKAGEFVSIVGSSGCGKSTLLKIIAGLEDSTSGEVLVDSEKVNGPHYERGIVFQDPTLFPWLSVEKNVSTGLAARHILKEKKDEVNEFIKLVGLDGFQKVYPHQLSGGMAQRVALARALINHPKVLLLDEPLGALDSFTRMQMQDEILRIWKERKTTVIMVTHDIREAIYMSDRIFVFSERPGKIMNEFEIKQIHPRDRNNEYATKLNAKILKFFM